MSEGYDIPIPIADMVYRVLYENSPAREEVKLLREKILK